jgi:restriction endonuclease S subunit/type I restriction-modification system DNA methylase subunit
MFRACFLHLKGLMYNAQYTTMSHPCPRCEKLFKTPATLARHTGAKKQCAPVAELRAEAKAAAAATPLARSVWEARNLMRRAGITGMESLDCIVALFALREVERLYPRLADPATWAWPKEDHLLPFECKFTFDRGLYLFSQLAASNYDDGENRDDWHVRIQNALGALKYHPDSAIACAPLYEETEKMFPLTNSAVAHSLVKLVDKKIPFDASADSAGRVFMSIVCDFLDGKELGQFFTPTPVIDYLTARAAEGRALGRVFDPTCGSGGFLAAAARGGAAEIHGCEIDIRVRLLGYFNALVSGAVSPFVRRADFTLGQIVGAPFSTVLANPPFGVKGVKYLELTDKGGPNDIKKPEAPGDFQREGLASFPLKSSSTGLFLQRIVRCITVGGRGCVVLPLGKELASRSAAEILLRRAFLTAVDLREIVVIPAGAFENTSIRTVALVFDKRRELGDCVERKKRGKGFATELLPGLAPTTHDIRFTQLKTAADGKTVLAEAEPIPDTQAGVSIEQLEESGWSLSPDDYKIAAAAGTPGAAPQSDYPAVRLGDICTFAPGKAITKAQLRDGPYPVVGGGMTPMGVHAEQNTDAWVTIISTTGASCGWVGKYSSPTFRSADNIAIEPYDIVDQSFLHHMLVTIMPQIQALRTGMAQPHLDKIKFANLEIPLPPLEIQRAIAAELDAQVADAAALEVAAAAVERVKKIALDNALYSRGCMRTLNGDNRFADGVELVRLGDICAFKAGKSITKAQLLDGPYPVVGGGVAPMGVHTEQNTAAGITIVSVTGSCGWVGKYNTPTFRTADNIAIEPRDIIDRTFLHHLLVSAMPQIREMRTGMAQPHLDKIKFANLEIPFPPIKLQRAIATELDNIDTISKGLRAAAERARASIKTSLKHALVGGGPDIIIESDGVETAENAFANVVAIENAVISLETIENAAADENNTTDIALDEILGLSAANDADNEDA